MKKEENLSPEWSHLIDADEVAAKPLRVQLSPDLDVQARLNRRLGLLAIDALEADLTLSRQQGDLVVHVAGRIKGEVQQSCVVTLDPVEAHIDETFEAWFADPEQAVTLAKAKRDREVKASGGEVPMLEESEDPEPIMNGKIDVGELVVQHLSLALNPYPHAEGVHYEYGDDEPQKVPEAFRDNPFAALKDWKTKLED